MADSKDVAATTTGNNAVSKIDLSRPRYDQNTFGGRLKHFFQTVNPLNIFVSARRLEEAAELVRRHKRGETPPDVTEEQLWKAKRLYDSAYHPDTGEKMFIVGRMSFQVFGNMTIIGLMMTFYKSSSAVIFWQWVNQSFNAVVNYTNRSGDEPITLKQLAVPYVAATTGATATALALNLVVAKRMPPLIGRFVPFVAVAVANAINIPLMRQRELRYGIPVVDEEDKRLGMSKHAAQKGIFQVVFSRVTMAAPGMVIPPFIMHQLERRRLFKRLPWLPAPLQVFLVGLCLVFATPVCCALFPQRSSISLSKLEPELREAIHRVSPDTKTVYFNKGL